MMAESVIEMALAEMGPHTLPGRPPPSYEADFWGKKINVVGHCVICLGRISGSRRDVVSSMSHIWPYLRESWDENVVSDCDFIVGKIREQGGLLLESKVPAMCVLCRDSVKTLDKLHQELTLIRRRIDTQVSGIQRLMESNDFEEESAHLASAMDREKLPLRCVENTIRFLGQLHGRNFAALQNFLEIKRAEPVYENAMEQFSSIAASLFFQKECQRKNNRRKEVDDNTENEYEHEESMGLETKPCLSITPNSSGIHDDFPGSEDHVIKTELDSDYEFHNTPLPDISYLNSFLDGEPRTRENHVETQDSNLKSNSISKEDNYPELTKDPLGSCEETGRASTSHSESSRKRPRRTTSRGFIQPKGKKPCIKSNTDSDDSDFSMSDEDEDYSSGESEENIVKPKKTPKAKPKTPDKTTKKLKSPTSSKKKPPVSRQPTKKKKQSSETEHSFSDEDSKQLSSQSGPDDDYDPTTDADEDLSTSTKLKKVGKPRSSTPRSSRSKKVGRPRIHPVKERKRPVRNTLCEICCENVAHRNQLLEHLKSHVQDYACTCPTCGTAYVTKKRMEAKHFKKAIRCRLAAGYPAPPAIRLKGCYTCSFETDSYLTLKSHIQEHENLLERNCPCPLPDCTESFTTRQMVEFHIDKHMFQGTSSAASQKCSVCSEAIEYAKQDMKTHLQTVHNVVEIAACNYCPHVFHSTETLLEHLLSHLADGVCCHMCQEKIQYYKADHLREHFFNAHNVGTRYSCDSCDYKTFSKHNLRGHQAVRHQGKYRKTFTCELCTNPPVTCRSKNDLVTHNIKVHGAKPYQCKMCGETFEVKLLWSKHEKEHYGIAPRRHQCPHCDKSFNVLSRLQYHIDRVHNEKPMEKQFKCSQCEKSYYDSHALKRHVEAIHLGITYMCEECGRSFSEPGPLKHHKRRHTGERPYKCSYCPNDFRYKDAHRRHEESHQRLGDKFQPGRTFDRKRKPL